MNGNTSASRGHRLVQLGILLFLLGLLVGFAIPALPHPRLGLSSHLEGVLNGMFLALLGLIWPRLQFSPRLAAVTFWLAIYGTFANFTAILLAAIWGAGRNLPLAANGSEGTATQETIVLTLLVSLAIAMVVVCCLVLYGLRGGPKSE